MGLLRTVSKSRTVQKSSTKRDSRRSTTSGWPETSNSESNTSLLLSVIPSVIHLRILPVQLSTFSSSFPPLPPSFSVTILLIITSSETKQPQSSSLTILLLTATPLERTPIPSIWLSRTATNGSRWVTSPTMPPPQPTTNSTTVPLLPSQVLHGRLAPRGC